MSAAVKKRGYTFEEFCSLIKDGQKADLIDGVIYVASPDNTDANDLFGWVYGILYAFVQVKQLGKVYGSRVAFRLGEGQGPEPDVAFVREDRTHLIQRGFVDGPPDVAIEIVSPESIERDYVKKRKQYQDAGVPEYWILDEIEEKVILLRLDPKGDYRDARPKKGVLSSEVVPGFWIRPEWLWQVPRPSLLATLTQLLAK